LHIGCRYGFNSSDVKKQCKLLFSVFNKLVINFEDASLLSQMAISLLLISMSFIVEIVALEI